MAELKVFFALLGIHFRLVLHGFTAVAELKGVMLGNIGEECGVLHGFTAVAELKGLIYRNTAMKPVAFSTASPPWPN